MRQYITTAIDYPNAAPHMGHVLEKVLADVIARWFRLRGDDVRFQIGTDEHGVKIQRAAEKEGVAPQALVDRNVVLFEDLYKRLGISSDEFIRTSDRKRHFPTVEMLWKKLQEQKLLEKRKYTGLYCAGCEKFLTKKELVDGKCPNHLVMPEEVEEENWFFLLQKEASWLKALLKDSYRIIPDFRAKEALALIEQGLEDVSFSRPRSSLSWGIPVPGDETQVMYVWCDALTNYISGLDYFGMAEVAGHAERSSSLKNAPLRPPGFAGHTSLREVWWENAEVTHVIGKDIARFHALIWPAMLKGAGVRTPDRLLIHGFLNIDGQKMSKSLGNVVNPENVLTMTQGNPDPLRFFLSHEIPVGRDGDFSCERFEKLYDAKLRNTFGNLLNRVLVLLKKEGGPLAARGDDENRDLQKSWGEYEKHMNAFELSEALAKPIALADKANQRIDARKVWSLKGEEKKVELSRLAENLRHIALMLLPFIPGSAKSMCTQLGVPYAEHVLEKSFSVTLEMKKWGGVSEWKTIGEPAILFLPFA